MDEWSEVRPSSLPNSFLVPLTNLYPAFLPLPYPLSPPLPLSQPTSTDPPTGNPRPPEQHRHQAPADPARAVDLLQHPGEFQRAGPARGGLLGHVWVEFGTVERAALSVG